MKNLDQSSAATQAATRWQAYLHQMGEAKEGLRIRHDRDNPRTRNVHEEFTAENYDSIVGASGTNKGKEALLGEGGRPAEIIEVPPYYKSQMKVHPSRIIYETKEARNEAALSAMQRARRGKGPEDQRPEYWEIDDNADVATDRPGVTPISKMLKDAGIEHVAVDVLWMLRRGDNAGVAFQKVIDQAGQPGKVTIVNKQGTRGIDIPWADKTVQLGGPIIRRIGRSDVSTDMDTQGRARGDRSGYPSDVYRIRLRGRRPLQVVRPPNMSKVRSPATPTPSRPIS